MASIHKLNARKVATAGPGKYEDGGGLRLVVAPTGSKKWVLRYTIRGRRREMGLGSCLQISLSDARSKASELRSMIYSGADPLAKKNLEEMNRPQFARHLSVIQNDYERGEYEQEAISRRV